MPSRIWIAATSCVFMAVGVGLAAADRRGARTAPVPWQPDPARGLADDLRLKDATGLPLGGASGPEDLAPLPDGRIAVSVADGRVLAIDPAGGPPSVVTTTGGRPLGLAPTADGGLYMCEATTGLLRWSPSDGLRTVSTAADGLPYGLTNAVDVGPDGTVYFTDSTWRYDIDDLRVDLLDGRPRGRLLAYTHHTRETRTLASELAFANGVAVDPSGDFVLVVETWRYRVLRRWLQGPNKGKTEVFIDALPGFPDGISAAPPGGATRYWLSLFAPRSALSDLVAPRAGLRRLLLGLPRSLWPGPSRAGIVLGLDAQGAVVQTLRDPSGAVTAGVTSARQLGARLLMGTLDQPQLLAVDLPR